MLPATHAFVPIYGPPIGVYHVVPYEPYTLDLPNLVNKSVELTGPVHGDLGTRTAQVWDGAHPDTPGVDPLYVWPHDETAMACLVPT